jgi:hypothetical protein
VAPDFSYMSVLGKREGSHPYRVPSESDPSTPEGEATRQEEAIGMRTTSPPAAFRNLKVLNLEANSLIRLPTWLAKAPKLQQLRLSRNPLTCVPALSGGWPALTELYTDVCDFGPVGILVIVRKFDTTKHLTRDELAVVKLVRWIKNNTCDCC